MSSDTAPQTISCVFTLEPSELVRTLLKSGWSQERIASAAGVSQPTVCRIYSGRNHDPRYSVVSKLRQLVLNLDEFKAA